MNKRNDERMLNIYRFISEFIEENGQSPTTAEICAALGLAKSTVSKFVCRLVDEGMIERTGRYGLATVGDRGPKVSIPIVGRVACGKPKLATEDIDGYLTVDRHIVGEGEFFALTADGDSMIEAGIADGDIVYVRRQSTAEEGQIVVAMITDEETADPTATLKRLYLDRENESYILHPENSSMSDIRAKEIQILGVAVRVLKAL